MKVKFTLKYILKVLHLGNGAVCIKNASKIFGDTYGYFFNLQCMDVQHAHEHKVDVNLLVPGM